MKKRILGITGGVGSGKSAVLGILEREYGAAVIQADLVAHELMEPGQTCYKEIVAAFGRTIVGQDGRIDRLSLGQLVFGDEKARQRLNEMTHPAVKQEIRRRMDESAVSLVVVEAALLLEDRYDEICDEIWYVYADQETRFARLAESRGYTRKRSQTIMDSQMGETELRRRCQATIDNSKDLEQTRVQLAELLRQRGFLNCRSRDR